MAKIRVLIVDDSVVIRRLLTDILSQDLELEVAGIAANGQIALAKLDQVNPDIVTMDIEMPIMDGLETLKALRKTHPKLPVIMFSTLTERGSVQTLDALALGASDYVAKPANVGSVMAGMERISAELIPKIKSLCRRSQPATVTPAAQASAVVRPVFAPRTAMGAVGGGGGVDVLAIGVSTGGPNALATLLPGLMRNFPVPILIVQHLPPLFTRLLAERLASVTSMNACEGCAGAVLETGHVWVAPGGFHMEVERSFNRVQLRLHEEAPENSCRPAVDVLFRSVAKVYGSRVLAVILTGMGQDGLRGCESVREAGGQVVVQDEESSVVWGMPGAVSQAGLAEKVLPLGDIAAEINRRVAGGLPSGAWAFSPRINSTLSGSINI